MKSGMKMINRARSWMCQLCNKKEKGKEKKNTFKHLSNYVICSMLRRVQMQIEYSDSQPRSRCRRAEAGLSD